MFLDSVVETRGEKEKILINVLVPSNMQLIIWLCEFINDYTFHNISGDVLDHSNNTPCLNSYIFLFKKCTFISSIHMKILIKLQNINITNIVSKYRLDLPINVHVQYTVSSTYRVLNKENKKFVLTKYPPNLIA